MDTPCGPGWRAPTRQSVSSQHARPLQYMASLYGGAVPFFASDFTPRFIRGSSRASSSQGPLASVDEECNAPEPGIHLSPNGWYDEQSHLSSAGTCLTPDEARSNILSSAAPSIVSGLSAFEPTQPLTRQNSTQWAGSSGACMTRLPSSQSHLTEDVSVHDSMPAGEEEDDYAMSPASHADFLAIGSRFTQVHDYAASPINAAAFSSPPTSQPMQSSVSNMSSAAAKSSGLNAERRHRGTLAKQPENGMAATTISPKLDATSTSQADNPPTRRRGRKAAPQKTPYQRPKGPKVFCTRCDEHPDGFRGVHELGRHFNAKHKDLVTKYVCRDPTTAGHVPTVSVTRPLSDCKACIGRKQYGAYYNAAAHLRRTHFRPKPPRGQGKKLVDEKRGGKGGGGWPPMHELKHWFEAVLVPRDEDEAPTFGSVLTDADVDDGGEKDEMNWILGQAADGVASEYVVNDSHNVLFADAQPSCASGLIAEDDVASETVTHMNDLGSPTSSINGPAYGMAASVNGDVGLDQPFGARWS